MSDKKGVATSQQEETAIKKLSEKKEKAAVIYLGPAISGIAVPGTVYKNGLTPQMEEAVKAEPSLKRLLVEVTRAGQVRKEIKDQQSAAGICYKKALDYVKKKGVKG